MDLLFKEYASPFLLLDGIIASGRLCDFLITFNKQKIERDLWDLYLHKSPFDTRSWDEFRNGVSQNETNMPSDEDLETTIKGSFDLLQSFNPEGGEY